jgi:hypothetical protein
MAKRKIENNVKEPKYPMSKYFDLFHPDLHKYTRAYLEGEFRGILKTKDEWDSSINPKLEGNK